VLFAAFVLLCLFSIAAVFMANKVEYTKTDEHRYTVAVIEGSAFKTSTKRNRFKPITVVAINAARNDCVTPGTAIICSHVAWSAVDI